MTSAEKCCICEASLGNESPIPTTYSGYDLCLWNIRKGEVLSNELEGYLCEECKDAVLKFLDILKELKK